MPKENLSSRRSFLRGGAGVLGAGALAAGLGIGNLVQPGKAHAAEPLGFLPKAALDVEVVREQTWEYYFASSSGG